MLATVASAVGRPRHAADNRSLEVVAFNTATSNARCPGAGSCWGQAVRRPRTGGPRRTHRFSGTTARHRQGRALRPRVHRLGWVGRSASAVDATDQRPEYKCAGSSSTAGCGPDTRLPGSGSCGRAVILDGCATRRTRRRTSVQPSARCGPMRRHRDASDNGFRVAPDRIRRRRHGRPGLAPARLGQDDAGHVRPPLAGLG